MIQMSKSNSSSTSKRYIADWATRYDEWMETMNKLGANMQCVTTAEELYYEQQQAARKS